MNITDPRTLRTRIEAGPYKGPPRTPAQQARYDRILGAGALVMATFGPQTITLPNLALGLELSITTLRRMVVDMDYLLFLILQRHLTTLLATLTEIPEEDPDCHAKRRAAYLAATRAADGQFTHAHTLLVDHRTHLPEDLRDQIEAQLQTLAHTVAGPDEFLANQLQLLLNNPDLSPEEIETILPRCAERAAIWAEQQAEWEQSARAGENPLPPLAPPEVQPVTAYMTDTELQAAASGRRLVERYPLAA
jgi:AcrR family transcriptional regulator